MNGRQRRQTQKCAVGENFPAACALVSKGGPPTRNTTNTEASLRRPPLGRNGNTRVTGHGYPEWRTELSLLPRSSSSKARWVVGQNLFFRGSLSGTNGSPQRTSLRNFTAGEWRLLGWALRFGIYQIWRPCCSPLSPQVGMWVRLWSALTPKCRSAKRVAPFPSKALSPFFCPFPSFGLAGVFAFGALGVLSFGRLARLLQRAL